MKNYITRNTTSKFGYDFVSDGKVTEITSKTTDGYLKLPQEINGRKLIRIALLEQTDGDFDLDNLPQRTPRTVSDPSKPKTTTSSWEQFLTDEEKAVVEGIKAKAQARAHRQALMAAIAKAEAELAAMGEDQ